MNRLGPYVTSVEAGPCGESGEEFFAEGRFPLFDDVQQMVGGFEGLLTLVATCLGFALADVR